LRANEQRYRLDFKEERRLWDAIERIYVLEPNQARSQPSGNIIGELKERLHRWTRGGQYGFLFDNAERHAFRSKPFRRSISTAGTTRPRFWNHCSFMFCIEHRMRSLTPRS